MQEQGSKSRLDKIVESAGTGLASKTSRRGFLGKIAGAAGASLLGGSIILGERTNAEAALPTGCYSKYNVNVCYSAWQVTAAYPGYSGVPIFKGPSGSSPLLHSGGGPYVIPVGTIVGRMSNRDGGAGNGCPDPGPRLSCNGFLWGYWPGIPASYVRIGWMPYSGYMSSSPSSVVCGPAERDFSCNHAKSACPSYNGCGGPGLGTVTESTTYRPIKDYGSNYGNSSLDFCLRFAANSTAHGWFHAGDKAKRYGYMSQDGKTWSCVLAHCAAWIPYGCRGWCNSDILDASGTYDSCGGSGCCPSGSSA